DSTPPPAPTPSSAPTPPPLRPPAHGAPPMHTPVDHPELDDDDASGERDEVFEIFRTYDRDASGSIDRAEFARLLEALGMEVGEEELAIALDVVDANHSGRISWDEFKAWWSSR
ncbi:MAG: EF-hand domain-containing protein, partial [Myxococcota bacterium]